MSASEKQRAVVATADKSVRVSEKPLPTLRDDDVLLQVKAVTLNPTGEHVCPNREGLAQEADKERLPPG
jgi:NADPH:quinone reductase-like Zn-dependent oxidoreductase